MTAEFIIKWTAVVLLASGAFMFFAGALLGLADPEGRGGPIAAKYFSIGVSLVIAAILASIFWKV